MRILLFVLSIVLFSSCFSKVRTHSSDIAGVYATYKPTYIEQVFIERSYKGRIYPLPALMVYLRPDNTYVLGFCDNQISEAGKYRVSNDSITLYERYIVELKEYLQPINLYMGDKDSLLYLVIPKGENLAKKSAKVVPLKRDIFFAHAGFMRGQELPLDSIINNYELRSVEEQNRWTDSVWQSR